MANRTDRRVVRAAAWAAALVAAAALAGCGKSSNSSAASAKGDLHCYVGGTMRPAIEKLAADYQKQTGRKVILDYGDSGALIARIRLDKRGDLYVCHDPFLDMLMREGLGRQGWTVALVSPVIVVRKGNPKKIASLRDLARPGIKLGLTDATHSTMGYVVARMLEKAGLSKAVEANVLTRTRQGGEIANKVAMGELDATIVWNAVAFLRQDKLDAVPIEPDLVPVAKVDAVTSATGRVYDLGRIKVTIATLACSKQPEAATEFAEYVMAHRAVFAEKFGFTAAPVEESSAALQVYCAAGMRFAMDDLAETFRRKRHVKVQPDYSGSGVLISRLKMSRQGDLFLPGDIWYLEQVGKEGLIASKAPVAYFVPVILVAKGNPKGIKGLADLARPGVKLALGNPKACTVGKTTEELLARNKIDPEAIRRNTVFASMTVNELGVQVQMKTADAAIVWDAVAAGFAKDADVVPIPAEQNVIADVVAGVLTVSKNKPLAEEFVRFLTGPEGRAILVKHGYTVDRPKQPPAGKGGE